MVAPNDSPYFFGDSAADMVKLEIYLLRIGIKDNWSLKIWEMKSTGCASRLKI